MGEHVGNVHSGRSYYRGVFRIVRAQNRSKRSPRNGVFTANFVTSI